MMPKINRTSLALSVTLVLGILIGVSGTALLWLPWQTIDAAWAPPPSAAELKSDSAPAAPQVEGASSSDVVMIDSAPALVAQALGDVTQPEAADTAASPAGHSLAFNPPAEAMGGTCISGNVIDRYEAPVTFPIEVIVTPINPAGAPLPPRSTNPTGFFSPIEGLAAGVYRVEFKVPDGWRAFTPAVFEVTLDGRGSDCARVRFKLEALACLEVLKLDAGGDIGRTGPVGLAGWKMNLSAGSVSLEATTDTFGRAYFRDLAPGVWKLEEARVQGWEFVSRFPNETNPRLLDLPSPRTPGLCESTTFVNRQIRPRIVVVKMDALGNLLPGWKITLRRPDGTQPQRDRVTNAAGEAVFEELTFGEWEVLEETKDWWAPIGATSVKVTLDAKRFDQTVVFKNEALGCVDGYKINDLEEGLRGWQVQARNVTTGEVVRTLTNEAGYFQFKLKLGEWVVTEEVQPGWTAVTPSELRVAVNRPLACEHVRFKNRTTFACLDVYKRDHFDGAGLPGWTITLRPAFGGSEVTGQTDGTGWVRFNELAPGQYIVSERLLPDWVPVTPTSTIIELRSNGTCGEVTFVNRQANSTAGGSGWVPAGASPPRASAGSGACAAQHKILPGENLFRIALHYGVPLPRLRSANGLTDTNLIRPGAILCIPH